MQSFQQSGNTEYLVQGLSMLRRAAQLTPEDNKRLPGRLSNLGIALMFQFGYTGKLSDIAEAIHRQQRAVDLTPSGHADLPGRLSNLGNSLRHRFERTGDLSDILKAVSAQESAVDLTPESHPGLPGKLSNLGASLRSLYHRTGEISSISKAISVQERAVELTPEGQLNLPIQLTNLGNALASRFQRTGELSDIVEAISVQKRAVDLTPQGHPDLPERLSNLGVSFTFRFERTGDLKDITDSISAQRGAIDLMPDGHDDLARQLNNLGSSIMCRFEHTGDLLDITEAISTQQRALALTPEDDADLPSQLSNLGISFECRFERTGNLSDIAEAISSQQRALKLTPHDHPNFPRMLDGLGNSFMRRFERTDERSDIDEAISVQRSAVELTPEDHVDLPRRLSNLGNSFACRFESTGDLSDIGEAISAQRRAVEITLKDHSDLSAHLTNLATSLALRFERAGALSDIEEAISLRKHVLELTPDGHTDLPRRLTNLGNSLTSRFGQTKAREDVKEAILAQQRAIDLTPRGHGDLLGLYTNLAFTYSSAYTTYAQAGDLAKAIESYKAAATTTVGSLTGRLQAARNWAQILHRHYPQSPELLIAYDTAVGLIALMAGLDQTVRGRYARLQTASGLAIEAAAVACSCGRLDKAVEWLEQGRCVVWNQLQSLRTPLDDLRPHNDELAQRIAEVSQRLEHAGSSREKSNFTMPLSEKISLEDQGRAHLDLANEWNDLLKDARSIPGFEAFLLPLPYAAIRRNLPNPGLVAILNVDKSRCDAIVLQNGLEHPLHIPLPSFSLEKANSYRSSLELRLKSGGLRDRGEETTGISDADVNGRGIRPAQTGKGHEAPVHHVLRSLWVEVVKPILDKLGILRMNSASEGLPPRIWWCPTGPLSFLPLHASGIYGVAEPQSVPDYIVSSYTPTITALTDRVRHISPPEAGKSGNGLFLTNQPSPPDAPSIPGTTTEVQSIYGRANEVGVKVLKIEGSELTLDGCLQNMANFSCVHLACHGSQNASEPLESRFLFHKGALSLGTIIKSNIKNADLAFLSACQTSAGEEKLADEAVHLAAGMLAAGYRRVVGTMWSIGDRLAQQVAINFYEHLFTRELGAGDTILDGAMSAYALHKAVEQLRNGYDDSEHSLLAWIPFVHFGH